ncbi:MAG: hypothetical protein FJ304_18690 [Planctomycetes bacterium]|nr:hypothetical protein [Planctomycetota bacterium]
MMARGLMALAVAAVVAAGGLAAEPPKPKKATSARVDALFGDIRAGTYSGEGFPKLEWADVPALLELADSPDILQGYPVNPLWSGVPGPAPEGLVALYLIEGVRRGGKFPTLHGVTSRGVDVNKAAAQQKEFAKAYREWWAKAKDAKPADAAKLDPLAGAKRAW